MAKRKTRKRGKSSEKKKRKKSAPKPKPAKKKTGKKKQASKKPVRKKSGSKKKSTKKKPEKLQTGFRTSDYNRIRSFLWNKYKSEWKGNFKDFQKHDSPLSLVYRDCKALGKTCKEEELIEFYEKHVGSSKGEPPTIPQEFLQPRMWHELQTNSTYGEVWDARLWIVSQLLDSPNEVRGIEYDYYKKPSFKTFIDWVDKWRKKIDSFNAPYVMFTPPYWFKDRWETRVYMTDQFGVDVRNEDSELYGRISYGDDDLYFFEPRDILKEATDIVIEEEKKQEEAEKKPEITKDLEKIKAEAERITAELKKLEAETEKTKADTERLKAEKELEETKQKGIAQLKALYDEGLITKEQFRARFDKLS